MEREEAIKWQEAFKRTYGNFPPEATEACDMAIEALYQPERPKGRWEWKHRMKGGISIYTGFDSMGETHTITVDERYEIEEPYCPNCGKCNNSQWLDFCPNCGADMRGEQR